MKKGILKTTFISVFALFTASMAGFSIVSSQNKAPVAIAKSVIPLAENDYSNNDQILQTASTSDVEYQKFLANYQNKTFTNQENINETFVKDQINPHITERRLNISLSGLVHWKFYTWGTGTWYTGDVIIDSVVADFGNGVKSSEISIGQNANLVGHRVNWNSTANEQTNWSTSFSINTPRNLGIDDNLSNVTFIVKAHATGYGSDGGENYVSVTNAKISGASKVYYDGNPNLKLDNIMDNHGSWGYENNSSVHTSSFSALNLQSPIYIGESNYYTTNQTLSATKIFMSYEDLANKAFTDDELKALVQIYVGTTNLSNINFKSVTLDRANKKMNVTASINIAPNLIYDEKTFSLPIHVVNFNNLVGVANTSSTFWQHLQNGQTRYWSTKPSTNLVINENYLKALMYAASKQNLIKQLDIDSWGFIGSDKAAAIDKINGYAINTDNYQVVMNAYQLNHSISVINNLAPDAKVVDLINQNDFASASLEDYLQVLASTKISVDHGVADFSTSTYGFGTFNKIASGISISDDEIRKQDPYRTTWAMMIKNIKLVAKPNIGLKFIDTPNTKLAFEDDPASINTIYDVDLKYGDSTLTSVVHSYLYQTHGIDISQNISFKMEDGTMLDQDFKVTKAANTSALKIGNLAYVSARYRAKFASGVEEYVTLVKSGTNWVSPKYSNKPIVQLDASFNESKMEFLFNQELQLIVNPYQNKPGSAINASTPKAFGIDTVQDDFNGSSKILESWSDGKWSHTTDASGQAIFDGVFGADTNGNLDERGRLSSGSHHISITLNNVSAVNIKNDFVITVDKNPVKVDVKQDQGAVVERMSIKDDVNTYDDFYFSNEPIHFTTIDTDIASIDAQFLDQDGKWYALPVKIKSVQVQGKWTQEIDSTIDYAGFARVKISDQAGNVKTVYFFLSKTQDAIPEFFFDKSKLFDDSERELNSQRLDIFKSSMTNMILNSPTTSALNITKMDYVNNAWIASANQDQVISDYKENIPSDYTYGKDITSSQSPLAFAGDELKPFLNAPDASPAWNVLSKQITFNSPGLYKILFRTRMLGHENVDRYIYIEDPNSLPYDVSQFVKNDEVSNMSELPDKDEGSKENIDLPIDVAKKFNINIPDFLIKDISVKYSLPWYSSFNELPSNNLDFSKEGKYILAVTDIFGKINNYSFLVLDKSLSSETRKTLQITPIYTDESKPESAFWKGKDIWNYYRYEDEDHAKWEHDVFIKDAMEHGLTRDQAEWLFQQLKKDPSFDGSSAFNNPDFNYKNALASEKSKDPSYGATNSMSVGSKVGIIVGSVIGGAAIGGIGLWQIITRFRRRTIK